MSDFLRRLTLLGLIPRRPQWEGAAAVARPSAGRAPTGKTSAAALLEQLQARGFATNLRAVQRDLVYLDKLFPELEHDGQRAGGRGWWWRADTQVQQLPALDPAMALSFVMARELLDPLLPPPLAQRLVPYYAAAERVLADAGAPGWTAWRERVRVIPEGQPLCPAPIEPAVMGVVQTALLEGWRFRGRYQPRERDLAEYVFNPLGLVFRARVVYLVATLWDYPDPRHFALHRFTQADLLDVAATPPPGFDFDAYLASGTFDYVTADGAPQRVELRMSEAAAAHLEETPLSADQCITAEPQSPGWLRVSATLRETEQLVWWLRGFADQVEILAPPALRARLIADARGLAERYGLS
ncbi:WYL domain-containing protein [Thiorhodococcus mannitoliphagus]|uniref:WYL domain-containing protein n=1 Tax=Thiorhodococcus mannitoliphagus TaxID=329406 RepID=A0A6P1DYT7_9GAMM|nr:WYL domain-containing protein [Thiorhodococcus mannitoliphagus]NEX23388.1 WYL domain-containing protein [Thiorhodococcus mannitoliphagus]